MALHQLPELQPFAQEELTELFDSVDDGGI